MARREDPPDPARPIQAVPAAAEADPIWERLESQLKWHSQSSRTSQRWYKRLKLLELAVAAALPVVAGLHSPVWVTGGLAAVIVVLEGAQHLLPAAGTLDQLPVHRRGAQARTLPVPGQGWPLHRGGSPPVAGRADRGLISQEHAKWTASSQQPTERPPGQP
jgi:hypothetical protein